jgi:hypothetical protein
VNQIPKVVFPRKAVLEPAAVATTRALEDRAQPRGKRRQKCFGGELGRRGVGPFAGGGG